MSMRLLGSDLDGTLLQSDGTVAAETFAALRRAEAEGLDVIFITGRPPRWMNMISEMTGHQGKALTSNGAVMLDLKSLDIVWAELMDPAIGLEAANRLRSIDPDISFAVELARPEKNFLVDGNYQPRWEVAVPPPVASVEEMFETGAVVKLLARPSKNLIIGADEFLAKSDAALDGIVDVTHSDLTDVLIEMSRLGINKGSGLAHAADSLGIVAKQVAAVGDMPNDIPMIKWAGRGAAVANAHDEVKAVANEHLPSNDEHAVAEFINRILSGN